MSKKSKENKKSLTVSNVLQPYEQSMANFDDKEPLKAKLIDTPLGHMMAVAYADKGHPCMIILLMFVESRHFDREMKDLIKRYAKHIVDDGDVKPFEAVESELNAYFRGELTKFEKTVFTVCPAATTEFIRTVWQELLQIEYGETTTFSALAKQIGKPNAAQPVANACSRNCISLIIPCHRIMSAGKTSVNNSCIERRNWLLDHEKKYAPKK